MIEMPPENTDWWEIIPAGTVKAKIKADNE